MSINGKGIEGNRVPHSKMFGYAANDIIVRQ